MKTLADIAGKFKVSDALKDFPSLSRVNVWLLLNTSAYLLKDSLTAFLFKITMILSDCVVFAFAAVPTSLLSVSRI